MINPTTSPLDALTRPQVRALGGAVDDVTNAGSRLAAFVASDPPLYYRLVALWAMVLIARCERRLVAAFNSLPPATPSTATASGATDGQAA